MKFSLSFQNTSAEILRHSMDFLAGFKSCAKLDESVYPRIFCFDIAEIAVQFQIH